MLKKIKNKKTFLLTSSLIGCMTILGIGGIFAYFTDGDTATNEFTIGKISLDLQEPNWNPDIAKTLTPNQEIKKDPQIKNDGLNDEYVFMEVSVPYENVTLASLDGTKASSKTDTELFQYTINSGWKELGSPKKDTDSKTITHLYAYANDSKMTTLEKTKITPTLFDTVNFINIIEDESLETSIKEIEINAYGIQTSDINGGKTLPEDVWSVVNKQSPSTVIEASENPKTDIKE